MHPQATRPFRASIVARARFIEDLVVQQAHRGVTQYVLLGAGLDTFAQRNPELASRLQVFEIDRPGPQAWKQQRLVELKLGVPPSLHFVPVDFEAGSSWRERLASAGFDAQAGGRGFGGREHVLTARRTRDPSRGRSARGGIDFVMSFLLPLERADADERPGLEQSAKAGARERHAVHQLLRPPDLLQLAKTPAFTGCVTSPRPP